MVVGIKIKNPQMRHTYIDMFGVTGERIFNCEYITQVGGDPG